MPSDYNLDNAVRKIKDYPKKGIVFFDITSILTNPEAFGYCVDKMLEIYRNKKIDAVAGIESRGFIFASPFAFKAGIPLILVRKAGKLPGKTWRKDYKLEYGEASVEIHKSDVPNGANVLLIDDLIATGGTLRAAKSILEQGGASVTDIFGVIGLSFLNYKDKLHDVEITTLINYDSEEL